MLSLSFDSRRFDKRLRKVIKKMDIDLSESINDSADIVINDIKERVGAKIDIAGNAFQDLDPKTIRQNQLDPDAVAQFADYPLIRTGAMSGALGFGGPYKSQEAKSSNQVAIVSAPNTKAPYGKFHQKGGKNLPQRKWFGISREAEKKILDLMKLKINRLIDGK